MAVFAQLVQCTSAPHVSPYIKATHDVAGTFSYQIFIGNQFPSLMFLLINLKIHSKSESKTRETSIQQSFKYGGINMILGSHGPGSGFPSWLPLWFVLGAFGPFFGDFGTSRESRGSQNGAKMGTKSMQTSMRKNMIWDCFFACLWWVLGVFLGHWTVKNQCLV